MWKLSECQWGMIATVLHQTDALEWGWFKEADSEWTRLFTITSSNSFFFLDSALKIVSYSWTNNLSTLSSAVGNLFLKPLSASRLWKPSMFFAERRSWDLKTCLSFLFLKKICFSCFVDINSEPILHENYFRRFFAIAHVCHFGWFFFTRSYYLKFMKNANLLTVFPKH